ncbi:hypothetical protein [Anabaena azotica]
MLLESLAIVPSTRYTIIIKFYNGREKPAIELAACELQGELEEQNRAIA